MILVSCSLAWIAPAWAQPPMFPEKPAPVVPISPNSPPRPEPETQLLTPSPPLPPGDVPLLRRFVPGLADWLNEMPPVIRDASIKVHPRTFYFNRLNSNDTQNE